MRKLVLNEKASFSILDKNIPVIIRDQRGVLFYSTESMTPKVERFNLPKGLYFIDSGSFKRKENFESWPTPYLPPPQRDTGIDPKQFKVSFGDTPHKCVINWKNKTILFDTSFKEKPIPELDFILSHEHGHRFFVTEKFADLYAVTKMLIDGYNPSQTGKAQIDALSDKAYNRLLFIGQSIKQLKNGTQKFF